MTGAHANRGSLTQEPDRFSDAAWELLLSGQDVARRWRHDQLDVEHLIQVLFTDPAFRRWVEPLSLRSDALLDRLEDVLADQPTARVDDLFIGEDLEQLLDSADEVRARWGERLIDVPSLITAMGSDPRIGADLFDGAGLSADRLERLVGDLLLLARLESTDFPLDRRAVALNDLVDATVTGLQHEARGREVTLTARIADTPLWADLDPDRYGQIIGNLVGNALRFADREVVVTLWSAEGGTHLSVGDDGPGIAEADLPHVFERLYVAEHSPAVQESGSGLGLAIVRDLTERMGGSVTARRSSLGGAEFVVSFAPAPPPTP